MDKRMAKSGEKDDYDDPLGVMEDLRFQQAFRRADGARKKRLWDHSGTRPLPFARKIR
ncbi:hypothetical protein [Gehongia tenuis]|uniref:Uncharacterized protein n=1 Tax=Gehongia tenuis TaxID=2763655 RepID=A0A926D643_9FIRM|nr:hypothetical protein [Gehongia tenuis]MBC8531941.1 hypothetical protein [Gehongia tenuis]